MNLTIRSAWIFFALCLQPQANALEWKSGVARTVITPTSEEIEKRLHAIRNGGLREHYDYPIQVVRFGDHLTFVALSGETCVDYSLRLKREFEGSGSLWVAGYSNDILAYIPSERVLHEGGYEARRAMMYWSNPLHPPAFADTIEESIIAKVHELLHP